MRRSTVLPLILFAMAAFPRAQALSQDHLQRRGRFRDGSSSDFIEPATWPARLTPTWKMQVGEGSSTPLIVGDTIYVFTRRNSREVLSALDASGGAERWQASYPSPCAPGSPEQAHGAGPEATPLFHYGKIYTLDISGRVTALDAASGQLIWQTPESAVHPSFSAAASPVGYEDLVIVHPGNHEPLTAFDAETGQVRWAAGDGGACVSPIVGQIEGVPQVISITRESVIGVRPKDGSVLWRYPLKADANAIPPMMYGDRVIVSGQGMGLTALWPTHQNDQWHVEVSWDTRDVSQLLSNPVLVKDTLFGFSDRAQGQFFALDANTGRLLWLGNPRDAARDAIAKAGDILFLLNDDAEIIIARANRTSFAAIRRYSIADNVTWAPPAMSGNRILIKDVSSLTLWTVNQAESGPAMEAE